MGHSLCADHCPCLRDDFVYDPLRCTYCCDFLRSKFQGVTESKLLKSASAELERHIQKLRRFCNSLDPRVTLKVSSFVDSLRKAARQNRLDLDFFRNMSVGETVTGKYSDALSETHSMSHAHGSLASRPSSGGQRSGKYRKSDKTKEDMDLMKGQMASMQEAIEKLSTLPALIASIPALSGRKDSGEPGPGRQSEKSESGRAVALSQSDTLSYHVLYSCG